jgi:hypothetical protein
MTKFVLSFSQARNPKAMAEELMAEVVAELPGSMGPDGALVLATAAAGSDVLEVGERLAGSWPDAWVLGTSFEGVMAGGRLYRDEPAVVAIAWSAGSSGVPVPLILDAAEVAPDRMATAIRELIGRREFEPGDLIVLFPDAHHSPGLEAALAELGRLLAPACIAGSGASGLDGHPAQTFSDGEMLPGGSMIGVFIPANAAEDSKCVERAGATRAASPWLEITKCRPRWIDELDGEPAADWVRRQLGLDAQAPIEPHLDRLLARVRRRVTPRDSEGDCDYDERYVIGLDARRGSFSWPGTFSRGDELALALPDGAWARECLKHAVDGLPPSALLFQFACRARDETLHGDSGLEAAWLAHCARDRPVVGTIAPFQISMSPGNECCRLLVHSTVLAALGQP